MSFIRGFIKKNSGQALVEMALVLPLLIILLMGIFETGRIFGAQLVLNDLARQGARYGVVGHTDTEIYTTITSECAWLNPTDINVTIFPAFAERQKGISLNVKVDYPLELMTPFSSNLFSNPLPLSAECLMRIE
jgi:Flp pilus assembly protein TadG